MEVGESGIFYIQGNNEKRFFSPSRIWRDLLFKQNLDPSSEATRLLVNVQNYNEAMEVLNKVYGNKES